MATLLQGARTRSSTPLWFTFTTNTFAEGSNIFVSESKSSDKGLAVSNTGAVNPSAKLLQQVHFR